MNYARTTKAHARKLHSEGKSVFVLPSKVSTWSVWYQVKYAIPRDMDFDKYCAEYAWYNCNDETGHGLTFYKELED